MKEMLLVRIPPEMSWDEVRERLSTLQHCYPRVCCIASGRTEKPDWTTFESVFPEQSMALDGAVTGPSRMDRGRALASLSHHGHDCGQELCTCELMYEALERGDLSLFDEQTMNGEVMGRHVTTLLDHIDQDGIMSLFVLYFGHLLNDVQTRCLESLVEMEGKADRQAGFCRLREGYELIGARSDDLHEYDAKILKRIFDPLARARAKHGWLLQRATLAEISQMLTESFAVIRGYVNGKQEPMELQMEYTVVHEGPGYKIVRQQGSDARMAMASDAGILGVESWIVAIEQQSGRYIYTIKFMQETLNGMSPEALQEQLNRYESLPPEAQVLPLSEQARLVPHVQPERYFGGHEDLLANHQRGSRRSPEQFHELLLHIVGRR